MVMNEYLLVALGSALGGIARWLLSVRLAPAPLVTEIVASTDGGAVTTSRMPLALET